MTTVFNNILSPLGLAPTRARAAGRVARGFSVTRNKTKTASHKLVITDPEIIKALGKKSGIYVGSYDNATLATNAGKALINRKAEILANAA